MPILKSAKKKLRQDKKRNLINKKYIIAYKQAIKKFRKSDSKTKKNLAPVISQIDKAVKKKVINKNKANRLKSNITKLISKK